jgi:hypothetical protein
MNAAYIEKIWTAEGKLVDRLPLTEAECRALLFLIYESYDSVIPQKREVMAAQEAKQLKQKSSSELAATFFDSKVQTLERKYTVSLASFSVM